MPGASDAGDPPPRLSTEGKWVVDENGEKVVLRGVSLPYPHDITDRVEGDMWSFFDILERALDEDRGWYPRVLRFPLRLDDWEDADFERYLERYVDPAVERCREAGVYLMLDHHLIQRYDTDETDDLMRTFWDAVAPRYADEPHLLYDLFNEPTEPMRGGREAWATWREHAQPWVDRVREHAPETPLVVSSPQYARLTRFAVEDPFDGENIVYSGHIYPGWTKDTRDLEELHDPAAGEVPLIMTEWGFDGTGASNVGRATRSRWGSEFREWAESYESVGWISWVFERIWRPPMFDAEWNVRGGDRFHGAMTKEWLYERRNDHVPGPLRTTDATEPLVPDDDVPPTVPENVAVEDHDDATATVTWDPSTDGDTTVAYYEVFVDGVRMATVDHIDLRRDGRPTATVRGLRPDREYEVTVVAGDAMSNESAPSDPATFLKTGTDPVEVTVPRVRAADVSPDGADWVDAPARHVDRTTQFMDDDPPDATWRGLWTDDALAVRVSVAELDAPIEAVSVAVDLANAKRDHLEMATDREAQATREGVRVVPNDAGTVDATWKSDEGGAAVTVSLPWSTLDWSPTPGDAFGFDVMVRGDERAGTWRTTEMPEGPAPNEYGTVGLGE